MVKKHKKNKTPVPAHLGGHMNRTHVDTGVLKMFHELGCRTMADIGCGPGGQIREAGKLGYKALGIDGDPSLNYDEIGYGWNTHRWDYQDGEYRIPPVDLVWSCEFVEHVKPEYVDNFMTTFNCAKKYIAMTYYPIGKNGRHSGNKKHFNENTEEYWLDIFDQYGWVKDDELTTEARKRSTMKQKFFKRTGTIFVRK
jgi:cyclopropane fatty-acyl-phospholipid synthase-like methyltransferase